MKKISFALMILLVAGLFQVSCKKDNDEPEGPVYKQPTAAARGEIVTIPDGLEAKSEAGDMNAMIAVTYMELANAISQFSASFTIPEEAMEEGKKGGSKVYSWSYNGYSYWMTYSELADKYTWKYEWEFPGQSRFTYIYAEEMKDGKSGSWNIYSPEGTNEEVWDYTWSVNSSDTFTASLEWHEGETISSFDVVANANNSGSFKYYIETVLNTEVMWNADGSGSYTFYQEGGNITGSWTSMK